MTFEKAQEAKKHGKTVVIKKDGKFDEADVGKITEVHYDQKKAPREKAYATVTYGGGKTEKVHIGDIFFHADPDAMDEAQKEEESSITDTAPALR